MTHKQENINTKKAKKFPNCCECSGPTSGFPAWGYDKGTGNLSLKTSGIWWQDCHRTRGNRDSSLGGHKQNFVCLRPRGKEQWPCRSLSQNYLLVLKGLLWRCGMAGLITGMGTLAATVLEVPLWCKPSWNSPLTLPHSPQIPGLGYLRPNN